MAKGIFREAAPNSLVAATNHVKRRTRAISAGGNDERGTAAIQRHCLVEWFEAHGQILGSSFCRQFYPIGEGAEHVVFYDRESLRAVKSTHPNKFGHSVAYEGAVATPLEYLRRLVYHNWFFGDDIRLLGAVMGDDHMEVVTSQPWITGHASTPQANSSQIQQYFEEIRFRKSHLYPDGAFFYHSDFNLVAADAHSRNVLVTDKGDIVAIDIVIGKPGLELERKLRREFPPDIASSTPPSLSGVHEL